MRRSYCHAVVFLNVCGLTALHVLNIWRGGKASGAVSETTMFIFACISTLLALLFYRSPEKDESLPADEE